MGSVPDPETESYLKAIAVTKQQFLEGTNR